MKSNRFFGSLLRGLLNSFVLTSVVTCAGKAAHAISFDELAASQSALALSGSVVPNASPFSPSSVIGGVRYIRASSMGPGRTTSDVGGGLYYHSQDAGTKGTTYIRWDGTNSVLLPVQPSGLGSVDLTKDAATAIKVVLIASDATAGEPISVYFTLHSGTDRKSVGSFLVDLTLIPPAAPVTFTIPFAALTPMGLMGGADVTAIGAIEMFIDGNPVNSRDLILSFIGTNGNCVHVPVNGLVVDQCGVCNGNNSTCSDCLGVPNGPALPGIACPTGQPGICSDGTWAGVPPLNCTCVPDNTPKTEICDSLDNDCDGLTDEGFDKGLSCTVGIGACKNTGVNICAPDGTKACSVSAKSPSVEKCDNIDNDCDSLIDEDFDKGGSCTVGVGVCQMTGVKQCAADGTLTCSVTPGTPSTEICDGLDNDCDGQVDEDFDKGGSCTVGVGACQKTGVKLCSATGTLICSEDPGTPGIEVCDDIDNNCDGQVDEGAPSTGPLADQCGICKGDGKSCLDCKGTPNGGASIDICGICGGDGKSCVDCNGTVNGTAKTDECGVCQGNGTSCLKCDTYDQSKRLGDLDSGAKEQQLIIRKGVSLLRAIPAARKEVRFISKTLEEAQRLQILNWTLSWTLPIIVTDCQVATSVCVTTSNLPILSSYRSNNVLLRDLAIAVVEKIKKYRKGKINNRDAKVLKAAEAQFQANLKLSQSVPENQFACTGGGSK